MGRTALITGGTRGIGLGIATELAKAGFDLALTGRRDGQAVEPVLEQLRSAGIKAIYIQADVSVSEDRHRLVNAVSREYGKVNVLVNNAGIPPAERKDILEATEESFDAVINVNLRGPYFLTQLVAREMIQERKRENGEFFCIINISSISATIPSVNRGEYCISKAGIGMATRLWAARLGEYNIPVYEIRPGIIATDMTAGVREKYDLLFQQGMAIQNRWGTPEDVGKVAVAMATGSMPYSTGQVVYVDGGVSIARL